MAFYSYLSTKIIIAFITKSYQDLFGVRSYINAFIYHHKSLFLKPTNIICRQAEDTSIRFFVNY